MPSVPGKGNGGYRPGAGPKPRALDRRKPNRRGKILIGVSPDAALALQARMLRNEGAPTPEALIELLIYQGVLVDPALAQRLMLHFPACADVAQLYALALRRLAETTDD